MDNSITNILVASKIDDFQIVINKGSNDRVGSYMRFLVYEEGQEIFDPHSKKSLGKLEIPKGFFKVQHIQEQMTVLVSELKKEKNIFQIALLVKELDVEKEMLTTIKVGDKVKIVNQI
ncbi:hypothetical protein [Flavobacterium salmonis]|uniref:Uncharacterized protein n=1 Tax=Flavobacterium salmonis TaxID=2654844 RepID=A0A6V6YPY1_9FLAO|nr:hypothetical protein [Flavobacterium salmonis]CAD0001551.1 hypothetical protein FLAT13_00642 [Flavobacterium salmonis]